MLVFRQRLYTKYDESDRLKQMKDSDILAEKKKSAGKYHRKAAGSAVTSASLGAAVGAIFGKKLKMKRSQAAKLGAAVGAVLGASGSEVKNAKKIQDIQDYNDRLEYAQYQAKRREKKDWKQNMTQRDGYSY